MIIRIESGIKTEKTNTFLEAEIAFAERRLFTGSVILYNRGHS